MKFAAFLTFWLYIGFAQAQTKPCDPFDFVCNREHRMAVAKKLKTIEPQLRRLDRETYRRYNWPAPINTAGQFRASQKLWLKFAEADCRFESEPMSVSQGSGYGRAYERCMAQMYDKRLAQVEEMIRSLQKDE